MLCTTLQGASYEKICKKKCKAIGNAKSPIAFYYRKTKKGDKGEINYRRKGPASNLIRIALPVYSIMDNKCYKVVSGKNGETLYDEVANFCMKIDTTYRVIDSVDEVTRSFSGTMFGPKGQQFAFSIDSKDWVSDSALAKKIMDTLGMDGVISTTVKELRDCHNSLTESNVVNISRTFGYTDDKKSYITPETRIDKTGVYENDQTLVILDSFSDETKHLNIKLADDTIFRESLDSIKKNMLTIHAPEVTHSCLAAAMMPIIGPHLSGSMQTKYAFMLRGTTGSGKTLMMKLMQNFYGDFDTVAASWTGTPNSIEKKGYYFKDAIYGVDDFKKSNLAKHDYAGALRLIQNYADAKGRSRLNIDATMQQTHFIRGWMVITGEDSIEGEASSLARTITINVPNVVKDIPKATKLLAESQNYSVFTSRFIKYILEIVDKDPEYINNIYADYNETFYKMVEGSTNDARIAKNISMLATSYNLVSDFVWTKQREIQVYRKKFMEHLQERIVGIIDEAEKETASNLFWDTLHTLLANGTLKLQRDYKTPGGIEPEEQRSITGLIGFWSKDLACVQWPNTHNLVNQHLERTTGRGLSHSAPAVLQELFEKDLVTKSKTIVRKMNDKNCNMIYIKLDTDEIENE